MRRFSFLLAFLLGCSSSDGSSAVTSPGGSGGESGSAGGRVCSPGSTQACIGPGACKGGQSCAFDGSGWSPCDCGTGGTGGSGVAGAAQAGQSQAGQSQGGAGAEQAGQAGTGGSVAGTGGTEQGGAGAAQGGAGQSQGGAGAAQGGAGMSQAGSGGTGGSGPAGSGGSGQAGSGQAGTGAGGVDAGDTQCLSMSGDACQNCCNSHHSKSKMDYSTDLVNCACFAGCADKCEAACQGLDDPGCNTCLVASFQNGNCTFDDCTTEDCGALNNCVISCPD